MNTSEIRKATEILDKRRDELKKLLGEREMLNCSGHQNSVSIVIGGGNGINASSISVGVTGWDQGYTSKVIRGREMIMLGAIKVYDAAIDAAKARVVSAKDSLRKLLEAS